MDAADEQNTFGIFWGSAVPGGSEIAPYQRVTLCSDFFRSNEILGMTRIRGNAVQTIDEISTPCVDGTLVRVGCGRLQDENGKKQKMNKTGHGCGSAIGSEEMKCRNAGLFEIGISILEFPERLVELNLQKEYKSDKRWASQA